MRDLIGGLLADGWLVLARFADLITIGVFLTSLLRLLVALVRKAIRIARPSPAPLEEKTEEWGREEVEPDGRKVREWRRIHTIRR